VEIIQHTLNAFLQVAELVLGELEHGIDYPRFQLKLQDTLNELGQKVCCEVLQAADDYVRQNQGRKKNWVVVRRDKKKVLSPFGEVDYARTYFRHKETGKHRYLVDEMAGYDPHTRVDITLKANLVETASELSYRKSGKEPEKQAKGTQVSGQTVLNSIRAMDPRVENKLPEEKRKTRIIYIEADEDHVPSQDGRVYEVPLVYVHEGKDSKGTRHKLNNIRYFSGDYRHREELWYEILDYLEQTYVLQEVESIYISGDGANWIKAGIKIIPKSVFILDRYHLSKYLMAVGKNNEQSKALWGAINDIDLVQVKTVLKKAYQQAETEARKKAIRITRNYITTNWDGIKVCKTHRDVIGCSAEGHVSHVLSARLSSRPMGWSRHGMDQMARIRVLKSNSYEIKKEYLRQHSRPTTLLEISLAKIQRQQQQLLQPPFEMLGNIPALKGPKRGLSHILRLLGMPKAV